MEKLLSKSLKQLNYLKSRITSDISIELSSTTNKLFYNKQFFQTRFNLIDEIL